MINLTTIYFLAYFCAAPELDEWIEMCETMPGDEIYKLYPLYFDGYVSILLMGSNDGDNGVNQELPWPMSIFISDVSFDLNELHTQCGLARRAICQGEYKEAEARAKAACAEVRHFLDDDQGTDAENIQVSHGHGVKVKAAWQNEFLSSLFSFFIIIVICLLMHAHSSLYHYLPLYPPNFSFPPHLCRIQSTTSWGA